MKSQKEMQRQMLMSDQPAHNAKQPDLWVLKGLKSPDHPETRNGEHTGIRKGKQRPYKVEE